MPGGRGGPPKRACIFPPRSSYSSAPKPSTLSQTIEAKVNLDDVIIIGTSASLEKSYTKLTWVSSFILPHSYVFF